jgi:hypothetical protein
MKKLLIIIGIFLVVKGYSQVVTDEGGGSSVDTSKIVFRTRTINGKSLTSNINLTDTAQVATDTVKLISNKIFSQRILSGSISIKRGANTQAGYVCVYLYKGTGNSYTITQPTNWWNCGTDVYDDILNTLYQITYWQIGNGIICYVIKKHP